MHRPRIRINLDPERLGAPRPAARRFVAMRNRQVVTLLMVMFFIGATLILMRSERNAPARSPAPPHPQSPPPPVELPPSPPTSTFKEHIIEEHTHPVEQLVSAAQADLEKKLKKQSRTLDEAVAEYKSRYGVHPPPNFDRWFEMAKAKKVQFIDEYDTIHQLLLPFWGLPPATIRARAQEALGFKNMLMRVSIRDGKIAGINEGDEWQQKATKGMMESFLQYLPDMDLAFNIQDESRVVIPHDDLQRLVSHAVDKVLPKALAHSHPQNAWSASPSDLSDGADVPEVQTTRFNVFAHQPTWTNSRQSCPPESPARSLEEVPEDDIKAYSTSEIGFVANKTAFTDICNSPSFQSSFGFFDRPNAFNIVHDLFPIFSQSKVSSFQDLIYPSPWYWADKVPYLERQDYKWEQKEAKLYWRGSTTGGFSRHGGWRRQHRQAVVKNVNGRDNAVVLERTMAGDATGRWRAREVRKTDLSGLFDVRFSHVGQCDEGDCNAQREAFDIAPTARQEGAWRYKYLLDVDGNAFSGRFYAFLRSRSLILKMAVFREWHDDWIRPWAHYVPLSLRGSEYFETLRYFDHEAEGQQRAKELADNGRDWAEKVLRKVDMETWFFRLLLEYGRLVDDNRESIGFAG